MADAALVELRPYLFSIAYRMLGSVPEAEDVVQETYVRLATAEDIEQPKAYAATVTTRLAIDVLRSARVRRETYVGTWLPEPLLTGPDDADPAHRIELDESVSTAFLLLLERLSPLERAAFVLREVFDYPYEELGRVLERSEDSARQLVARARRHVADDRPRFEADPERRDALATQFFSAWAEGDVAGLERMLAEDVHFVGDGGGKSPAVLRPVVGRVQVARFLVGLLRQGRAIGVRVEPAEVNGQPGVRVVDGEGRLINVIALQLADGLVLNLHAVANPDKLRHLGSVVQWDGAQPRPAG